MCNLGNDELSANHHKKASAPFVMLMVTAAAPLSMFKASGRLASINSDLRVTVKFTSVLALRMVLEIKANG